LTIIATLKDGRVIAKADIPAQVATAAGTLAFTVTLSDLRKVEYLIQVNPKTSPGTYCALQDFDISGNVVGLTVYVGAGTTLTGEVIGIGF